MLEISLVLMRHMITSVLGVRLEEVGHMHTSAFCINTAHYFPLLKYTTFNSVL